MKFRKEKKLSSLPVIPIFHVRSRSALAFLRLQRNSPPRGCIKIRSPVTNVEETIGASGGNRTPCREEKKGAAHEARELLPWGFDPSVNFQRREMKKPMERN